MSRALLVLHVLAAIIAIGPVTVAASMFPPAVRKATQESAAEAPSATTAQLLHRICRRYATLGLAVPVLGMATAAVMGVLGSAWLITSMVLTAAAAGILVALVVPRQEAQRTTAAVALAVIPGIGGMLALRSLPTPQARARTAPQMP
ncbi:hypothetical protein [Streptomyces coeruleofuscus]|uniref:DUF2269 family protein n=1 Tax=Streptomyces coeruleofuscus TaxID=66879 RepID=A0ABN3HLK4_9ACTN